MVQLIHWGPAELEGGVIDPSRFGSNRHTMSDLRARGDRFAMFYVRDEDAEGVVMGCGGGDGGRKVRAIATDSWRLSGLDQLMHQANN